MTSFRRKPGSEEDVPRDEDQALSRETGGVPGGEDTDAGGTTGTAESGEFVGRVGGQDAGYAEKTGAEVRAEGGQAASAPPAPAASEEG